MFYNHFRTDEDCYKYLSDIKWDGNAFVCKKCGNTHYCKGHLPYSRRCTRCKYDESPTSRTMFDKLKFSLLIAFHIAFKISTKKKGMSSLELSEEYDIRQKTCWEFKWKIQQAMKSSGNHPLTGTVHVDEFYIGGEEEETFGRSSNSKKKLRSKISKKQKNCGKLQKQAENDLLLVQKDLQREPVKKTGTVKLQRAQGECLGTRSRRRTW